MTELNHINGIPLYIQIRETLLEEIRQEKVQKGQRLPTEEYLANKFNVSRMTIRQALGELVREGILERRRGLGTFVVSQRMTRHYNRLTSFYEEAIEQGLKPSSITLKLETIPVLEDIAKKLEIKIGDQVYYIERLRLLNGEPIALHIMHIPYQLFPDLNQRHLEGSLYRYYEDKNKTGVWASQRIEARTATHEQCRLLKLPRNAPVLYSARITYTKNDVPIEFTESFAGGAPYAIEATLFREGYK